MEAFRDIFCDILAFCNVVFIGEVLFCIHYGLVGGLFQPEDCFSLIPS